MLLTTQQVKDQLHIGDGKLARLIADGTLVPANKAKEGAKKFFRKFNSADVNKLRMEMKANGSSAPKPTAIKTPPVTSDGIRQQLARIEAKLDRIVQLWS